MTSSLNGGSARSYDRMKYEYDVSIILYRMCYKHNTQEIDNRLFKLTYTYQRVTSSKHTKLTATFLY